MNGGETSGAMLLYVLAIVDSWACEISTTHQAWLKMLGVRSDGQASRCGAEDQLCRGHITTDHYKFSRCAASQVSTRDSLS